MRRGIAIVAGGDGGPVAGAPVVLLGILQLKGRAGRGGRPRCGALVAHLGDDHIGAAADAGLNQCQRLAVVLERAVEGVKDRHGRAIRHGKRSGIGGQREITVRRNRGTRRKGVGQTVELPAGQIERVGAGVVVQLDKLGSGHDRVEHDLIDDNLSNGGRVAAVVSRVHIPAGTRHRLAVNVHAHHAERVVAGLQRHRDAPTRDARPGDRIFHAVDPDGFDVHRRRAGHGSHTLIDGDRRVDGEAARVLPRELRGDAVMRLGEPGFDGRIRVFGGHAVGGEGVELGIKQRTTVGDVERTVHQFLQRPPIHAPEGWFVVNGAHVWIRAVDGEKILAGAPRAAVSDDDVEIKHHQRVLRALGADVAVQVLRVVGAEGVPVARRVIGGKHAHPILHVGLIFHVGDIVGCAGRTGGVHERKDPAVIARRTRRAPHQIIVAVTRRLLGPAGGCVGVQRTPGGVVEGNVTTARVRAEFKPRLHLVEPATVVIRKMFLDHVAARCLRVFHQSAAAVAIHIHDHVAPVEPGHAQSAQEGVGQLLALDAGIIARAVAGLMNFVVRSRAQQLIVIGEDPFVMAQAAVGRVEALMVRAAGEPRLHVVNHPAAGDERAVVDLIAEVGQLTPPGHIGLCDPQVIHAKTAGGIAIAKHHHALPHRGAIIHQRREAAGARAVVRGRKIKCHHGVSALTRNGGAEQTVAGDGVAAGAVILHRDGGVTRGGVNPVVERETLHGGGVVSPCGDHGGLTGRRQGRRVGDLVNRGTGVGQGATVDRSRRAEVCGHRQPARGFEPVAVHAQERLRPAAQPARLEAEGCGLTGRQGIGVERHLTGVCPGPHMTAAPNVQRLARPARVTASLNAGTRVITLQQPGAQARLEVRSGDQIRSHGAGAHLDVVHETFADVQLANLRVQNGGFVIGAVVEHAGGFDVGPGGFLGLVAVRPVGGEAIVGIRIGQLQAASAPGGPLPPAPALVVSHFIHHDVNLVGRHLAETVGGGDDVRHGQRDAFAAVRKFAAKIAEAIRHGQVRIIGPQFGGVARDHQIVARLHYDAGGEGEADAVGQLPARERHGARAAVVKLDVLKIVVATDRLVHQFIDHDVAGARRGIGGGGRFGVQPVEIARSVRPAPGRHAVFLISVAHGVEIPALVGVLEVDGFSGGIEAETQRGFVIHLEATRGNRCPGRDDKFVRRRVVREDATGNVHGLVRVIVKLHVVVIGRVGVREKFVDDHVAERAGVIGIELTGRAADHVADAPGARIAFAVCRVGEDQ